MKLFSKKVIAGCEARGDADSPYLTRYTIIKTKPFQICLHVFHRSDADELHDHPWNFWTLILWRGYNEQTPTGKRRVWPGMLLYRPASHAHRVELLDGKRAVTLVVMGRYVQQWGFFTPFGWQQWQQYFKEKGC